MVDSTPFTLIQDPTIRRGTENASHVRSQLMRQRYREKRLRILGKSNQIDTQRHQIETPSLPAGNNLRPIAPCRIDPFLPDDRRTRHFDFLLHNCAFRDIVTIERCPKNDANFNYRSIRGTSYGSAGWICGALPPSLPSSG